MIFKTFNSDIDKISAKWGMFGRSFNDVGAAIAGRINDVKKSFQATSDLKGSLNNSDGVLQRLNSKKDIQSQMIDVDGLYPKIDKNNFNFDRWIETLNDIDKQVKNGSMSWQDYSNKLYDNQKWIAKWGQETEGQIRTQEDMIKANQQARAAALEQNEALKQQTLGAKASKMALSSLATAGNMLFSIGASKAIEWGFANLYELSHAEEIAAEKAKETAGKSRETAASYMDEDKKLTELISIPNFKINRA